MSRGSYASTVDAATAAALVEIAEEARAGRGSRIRGRRGPVEDRYPEMLGRARLVPRVGQPETAYRLASALVPFWIATTRIDDGDTWFERALGTVAGSEAARARALYDHGYLVFWAGRYDLAQQRFTESPGAGGEARRQRRSRRSSSPGLARVALNTDVDEAVRLLRQAVAVTEDLADSDPGRSSALHVLGVALQMSGDLEAAREVMSARLAMGRSHPVTSSSSGWSRRTSAWSSASSATSIVPRSSPCRPCGSTPRRGDEMSIAWTINGLAAVTAAKGDHERAATLVGMAAAMLERAGGEWPPDEREQYDETLATVTAGLAPDVLAGARTRGAGFSVTDGVAYALRAAD